MPSFAAVRARLVAIVANRKRALLPVAVSAAVLAMAVLAASWLGSSPRFAVKSIDIDGRDRLPEAALRERLAIDPPVNLFRYDTSGAEARLLESPWVKRASVSRAFPDGLRIEIEEHQPAAIALIGELYLLDAEGIPFKHTTVDEAAALDLYIVTGISREELRQASGESTERLGQATRLAATWRENPSRVAIAEVHIDGVRGFTVIPDGGAPEIRVGEGSAAQLAARFALFDRVWAALSERERETAALIHLDTAPEPSRVAVAFSARASQRSSQPTKEAASWAN